METSATYCAAERVSNNKGDFRSVGACCVHRCGVGGGVRSHDGLCLFETTCAMVSEGHVQIGSSLFSAVQ